MMDSGGGVAHSTVDSILASHPAAPGSVISFGDFFSWTYFWKIS